MWDANVILHEWDLDKKQKPRPYLNDLGELIKDEIEPINNLATWIYDGNNYNPSAKIVGEESYSIVNDYLGTPVQVYNNHGALIWERELDIYGKIRKLEGDKNLIPFRFQGQIWDEDIELAYNRFRYYDPESGNYLSQDPISLSGGLTLYKYVKDSNYLIDPFGLKDCFADANATKFAEEIIEKFGGKKVKDGHYQMPSRKAARQAASEIAGNMGNNPTKIVKGDFRGGPKSWVDNMSKIGQQSSNKTSGWRDDILGHDFGSEKIGSHVNAWNETKGVFSNLHLLY